MIKLTNIEKKFKSKIVLKNLSLTIDEGELIYISGANGSGKSTLFKIICGIIDCEKGSVNKDPDVRIGALIENPGFLESDSLKQNLKFLASLSSSYNEPKIRELCERFKLDYDDASSMKTYSVGMRQKAGIIQAIAENQNYIFLDEPIRGLDKESIIIFNKIIEELLVEKKAVIIASHDEPDLKFNRRLVLESGCLREE